VRRAIPAFASAWGRVANVRVRMSATIGGNVMARRTRYEMPILLGALRARAAFAGSDGGETDVLAIAEADRMRSLLTEVVIPLDGLVAFDYERSLRPIVTQAASVRRSADRSLTLCVAIGTEATAPYRFALDSGTSELRELAASAEELSRLAYRDFPDDFFDPMSSNAYLQHTGRVLLRRQLERLGNVAA
jgi:carbon-monoxide dehydrogenase medium subunit